MTAKRTVVNDLSVGQMARRAGVAVSTLHYYESRGLISSWRNAANHRRYDRSELRRVALVKVAQSVGLSLDEIATALADLPKGRKITKSDWEQVSRRWKAQLEARLADLVRLRDQLGMCIGCGCLSLEACPLYNPNDELSKDGPGPRRWS